MKIYMNICLENFEAWGGARDTLERIINEGKCDLLEQILEDTYPDGMTDTGLNDLLWHDWETVFDCDEDDEDDFCYGVKCSECRYEKCTTTRECYESWIADGKPKFEID